VRCGEGVLTAPAWRGHLQRRHGSSRLAGQLSGDQRPDLPGLLGEDAVAIEHEPDAERGGRHGALEARVREEVGDPRREAGLGVSREKGVAADGP